MPHTRFHPLVAEWFAGRFASATPVQERGWEAIASGQDALLSAPTGSGKTLAAFLVCIDDLVRQALAGTLSDQAQVVYVSPLKALSHDIHKNLEEPLAEIAALAEARGTPLPPIRLAVRTGDTPAKERHRTARTPPHIWITTPESLYVLLGSESGRRGLASVSTIILDEIHAVADDKRGAHLALSVERLETLAGRTLRRIGLSATVNPIEDVARLLVGAARLDSDGRPRCAVINQGHHPRLDLALDLAKDELGPIATHELWAEVMDRIADLARGERTTLVFVNTRRLVERVSHLLTARLGADQVVAHHGSLSRKTRFEAERRLKHGEVKVCVATASLELGIDVGTVDLACQIGSPRSVAVFLQRVGRSGHGVGRVPRGRLFPLTRDELVECAALLRLARRGELDRITLPVWPLDVLAQQIVATTAAAAQDEDALYAMVRRSYPYRDLPRQRFDDVVAMLAEGFATARGRRSALLHRDGVNRQLKPRRGARLTAITSGGAIPDNADYDVVEEPAGTTVGRVHEDFAVESMAGDVFLLGNASWRILRVEKGRVRVADARGQAPTIPFWLGEAPARTAELSHAVGALRAAVDARLDDTDAAIAYLQAEYGLDHAAAAQIVAYLVEGKRVLGVVPTCDRIVAERFFDEAGGMQLVIHSPLGGRINRAWGLALRKRFCRQFDFELQAQATDDGICLSLGPQHSFPLAEVFAFLHSHSVARVLEQAVLPSPIFTTRWRWTAARALALVRHEGGRRVPAPLQRMRGDDLMAAVFPAQTACQDNAPGGDIEIPDHPLVFETMRDTLTEALDLAGLERLLARLERGEVEVQARDTSQPSVFAHQILNAMPYAFLDDAPLEERRARAVSLRRALPEDSRDLGRLDPEAIAAARDDAWPEPRDADELHDALLGLVLLPAATVASRFPAAAPQWLHELAAAGRVLSLGDHYAAAERLELARAALAGDPAATLAVVRGWAEVSGPFTSAAVASEVRLPGSAIEHAAVALEAEGMLLRGAFTGDGDEWCDRRVLARIHRATLKRLRREIEPVTTAEFLRFLARWQMVASDTRGHGGSGLRAAIALLQGFEAPAAAWESALLPARVEGYGPELMDRLCLSGEAVWGRLVPRDDEAGRTTRRAPLNRASPLTLALREDLPWLVERPPAPPTLSPRARLVRDALAQRGASFLPDLARATHLLRAELDEALGELVAAGLATADGFAPLRHLARTAGERERRARFARRRGATPGQGRWSLLEAGEPPADAAAERAAQLLRRYGVVYKALLARETTAPPWRELVAVLRRAEARGEIRGGRFVAGQSGEQFALPEAVDALRAVRRVEPTEDFIAVSACDPLNLAGILTPGPRLTATVANRLVLRDGLPVAWIEGDASPTLSRDLDTATAERARSLLLPGPASTRQTPDSPRPAAASL